MPASDGARKDGTLPQPATPEGTRPRPGLLTWVSGPSALGGLVLGLVVNWLSDAYKGAIALAVGGTVLLVVVVAARLRRLPPRAPIQRLVSRFGLTGALLAAVVSLLLPGPWRPWPVLVAAAFAVTACLA